MVRQLHFTFSKLHSMDHHFYQCFFSQCIRVQSVVSLALTEKYLWGGKSAFWGDEKSILVIFFD